MKGSSGVSTPYSVTQAAVTRATPRLSRAPVPYWSARAVLPSSSYQTNSWVPGTAGKSRESVALNNQIPVGGRLAPSRWSHQTAGREHSPTKRSTGAGSTGSAGSMMGGSSATDPRHPSRTSRNVASGSIRGDPCIYDRPVAGAGKTRRFAEDREGRDGGVAPGGLDDARLGTKWRASRRGRGRMRPPAPDGRDPARHGPRGPRPRPPPMR